MVYQSPYAKSSQRSKRIPWLVAAVLVLCIAGAAYWFLGRNNSANNTRESQQQTSETVPQEEQPAYEPINLQPVINKWVSKYSADYHIAVYDLQSGTIIGQNDPDTALFAASLYKLYIAYLSLMDFQTGTQDPDEILVAGQTKRECVDKMIRSSDSPCGEAMMAEIGQLTLNEQVVSTLGTTGTFFNGIRTSASDSILVLKAIAERRHLTEENTEFLLDAMRTQPDRYKRGLQTGAPEATWETKVGWNEDINYHDVGIMTLPDGRKFAVAILGQGSGASAPIADFARTIYAALTQ